MSMDEHNRKPAGTNVGADVCPSKRKHLDLPTVKAQIEETTGPEYWRSLEELAGSDEFQEMLHREFPKGASAWLDDFSRRGFLKTMGASLALAGLTGCTRMPITEIVPYVKQPENVVPGRPMFYATAFTLGGYASPILVESHLFRPTKVEGNPQHPASLGGTDVYAQASILDLYDPDRAQNITYMGDIRSWNAFMEAVRGPMNVRESHDGGFIVDYLMPAGSSLEDTNRTVSAVEGILRATPEVESTSRRTGLQLGLATVTEANRGDISVKLKRKRDRSAEEVMAEVRAKVAKQLPMLEVEYPQLLQDMIGDLSNAPEPILIKLFSQDPAVLREWAPKVTDAIKKIPGVVDVLNGLDNTISGPALVFRVNPGVAARAGFTPQEVELDTSVILQGEPATTPVVVNDRAYTIRVRFPEQTRASLEAIRNTLLVSSTGKTGTLGTLADATEEPGQTEIRRENLQRDVAVTARLEGLNLGAGMAAVQKVVIGLGLPAAIRVAYGGGYEEQQRSFRDLVFVLVLAVLLVFIVLLFEFGSFAAPLAILASALLSTSGVFLALLVTGTTFNISSFMGLIMVIGIGPKNGILLLDADQKFRGEGTPAEESMIRAGERRLRIMLSS